MEHFTQYQQNTHFQVYLPFTKMDHILGYKTKMFSDLNVIKLENQ